MSATISEVRERPILFSGEMVRAILGGRKTQTRRVVRKGNSEVGTGLSWNALDWSRCFADRGYGIWQYLHIGGPDDTMHRVRCRIGEPTDRLWVRETWFSNGVESRPDESWVRYRATDREPDFTINGRSVWRSGIIMPRSLSRITLEIAGVRVERVQDISEDDAYDEGFEGHVGEPRIDGEGEWARGYRTTSREQFRGFWDSLNAKRGYGWDVNPWVWVIEFRRVESAAVSRPGDRQ